MAKKDAYYFPHFSNARHDRKIKRIIKDLGVEGYGIYFMLLEVLREQTDLRYPLSDIDLLADEFRTSEPKIRTIIGNYDLFIVDQEQMFFSPKQIQYLEPYFDKTNRARNAAIIRWQKHKELSDVSEIDANALQMESKSNADQNAINRGDILIKESIGKNKRFTPPSIDEVKNYCIERKNGVNYKKWYDHYTANGWMIGKNKMKDWKAAVRTWEEPKYSDNGNSFMMPTGQKIPDIKIPIKKL